MKTFSKISIIALAVVCMLGLAKLTRAATATDLGTAKGFAILAGASVTDVPSSVITGDVGLYPAAGSNYSGLTSGEVAGTIYATGGSGPAGSVQAGAALNTAKNDLTAAYTNTANAAPVTQTVTASAVDSFGVGTINNGASLLPGIYKSPSSMGVTGTLTLDGGGDPNAVFIFQAATTITTAGASTISLINGAQACNVFWEAGSSAAQLGANSFFKGTLMSDQTITLLTGANVEGRLLAFTGSVILDHNTITVPTCVGLPPPTTIASASSGGVGAHYFPQLPAISITKIPSPLSLPSGPGPVTYTYVVTNIGKVPMNTVWVKDNMCSPVQYVSGDTNGDGLLDLTETWTYDCFAKVTQTETDTATAHGYGVGLGMDVYDTASATVVVGLPIIPPLIHLVKTANPDVLPAGGGPVTYTYLVTNPGTAPLNNVSISDNKCTGLPGRVVGHPGDINKNNLLDPGETFHFTCQSNVTQTTTNIGTAEGTANGLTALDISPATVVVNPPALPNTGLPPRGTSTPWNIIVVAGALMVSIALVATLKKKRVA
jgi:uncharacterized repeat protein (TIGR01451 family)